MSGEKKKKKCMTIFWCQYYYNIIINPSNLHAMGNQFYIPHQIPPFLKVTSLKGNFSGKK